MKNKQITLVKPLKAILLSLFFAGFLLNNTAYMSSSEGLVYDLLNATNNYRQSNGSSALKLSPTLSEAAENKLDNMIDEQYWAHNSKSGKTPWNFINDANYNYDKAGENLAKNYLQAEATVEAWVNSESHRQNMLDRDYTEVGFASRTALINGESTTLTVAMYAKPTQKSVTKDNTDQNGFGLLTLVSAFTSGIAFVIDKSEQFWLVLMAIWQAQ